MDRYLELPKVNLHQHLEGAIRLETFMELNQSLKLGLPVEDMESCRKYLQVSDQDQSLADFLVKVDRSLEVSQYPGVLKRMAYETVVDAYHQNVVYLEIRFGPLLHLGQGRSLEQTIEEVLEGMEKAIAEYPIKARLIVCGLRHHSFTQNRELVDIAVKYIDDGLVGFDIAGDEASFPLSDFREIFVHAKERGLKITAHAGEVSGSAESVIDAIESLGADRIGHGVQIYNHPDIIKKVRESGTTLEVCPTSNVDTRAISTIEHHPIRQLYEAGVKITLGDDDPTTSGTTISHEYKQLSRKFGFTDIELVNIVMMGVDATFLPPDEQGLLAIDLKAKTGNWLAKLT